MAIDIDYSYPQHFPDFLFNFPVADPTLADRQFGAVLRKTIPIAIPVNELLPVYDKDGNLLRTKGIYRGEILMTTNALEANNSTKGYTQASMGPEWVIPVVTKNLDLHNSVDYMHVDEGTRGVTRTFEGGHHLYVISDVEVDFITTPSTASYILGRAVLYGLTQMWLPDYYAHLAAEYNYGSSAHYTSDWISTITFGPGRLTFLPLLAKGEKERGCANTVASTAVSMLMLNYFFRSQCCPIGGDPTPYPDSTQNIFLGLGWVLNYPSAISPDVTVLTAWRFPEDDNKKPYAAGYYVLCDVFFVPWLCL